MLSLSATGYMWLAVVYFEEPDLLQTFGQEYVAYMKGTPRFIPRLWSRVKLT